MNKRDCMPAMVLAGLLTIAVTPATWAEDPKDISARLIKALNDPDQEVRQNLANALARIGEPAVGPLVEALKDTDPNRRAGAAYSLALIGTRADSALPDLMDALSDPVVEVRRQVSYAISQMVTSNSRLTKSPDDLRTATNRPTEPNR